MLGRQTYEAGRDCASLGAVDVDTLLPLWRLKGRDHVGVRRQILHHLVAVAHRRRATKPVAFRLMD